MTAKLSFQLLVLSLVASVLVVACGSSATMSPASPSGVTGGGGATITGRVTGSFAAAATSSARTSEDGISIGAERFSDTASNVMTVTIVSTNSTTTVGPGGTFTLTGVPAGTVQLKFTGNGANATVTITGVQESDRIDIAVSLNGNSAKVESENRRKDNNGTDVNGRVTAVGSNTLQVGTTLVIVPAGAVIRHGSRSMRLSDIKIGDHVQVKGTRDSTGVVASEIKVESGNDDDDEDEDDDDDNGRNETEVSGAISLLQGVCPAVTFTLKTTTVVTNAQTTFSDVTCLGLTNGTKVEVKGVRTGTSLVATRVERD